MDKQELKATRDGFGNAILELGQENDQIVVLCADLNESLRLDKFKEFFPNRFIECGVAEQNMMSVGAGLALAGKIPFIASFAVFNPGRNLDQLRVAVYSGLNIKVIGGHAGISTGEDGATHQALEDLGIVCSLPKMIVVVPADSKQAEILTKEIATQNGPCYLRLGRKKLESIDDFIKSPKTELGKAQVLKEGKDLSIFACGLMVQEALKASIELEKLGLSVEVINLHTLKPLDEEAIIKSVNKTGAAIIAAEHEISSGLDSLVIQTIVKAQGDSLNKVIAIESLGTETFGESGKDEELLKKYGLDCLGICKKAKSVMIKKKKLNS
ncbi:MAG: Transketolase central region [Candidatus Pacebacteria bacterium GW2011_GWF2_38_9]|nr:MAG: transketolase, transketolase [candidate division TM6 bacterium GW2011_GWF2_28_16]KKQ08307.1 MAG: Transketolase central region [Candidatus Pacebacteria bacterium GW2011_GWF1_36_5]KKQ88924.1 MAG: Transketolase central region [Candidatus Pacebacteria bacterium GW2011_GWF2_38_9]